MVAIAEHASSLRTDITPGGDDSVRSPDVDRLRRQQRRARVFHPPMLRTARKPPRDGDDTPIAPLVFGDH